MARKRDDGEPLDRIFAKLEDAPPGLHDVDAPAEELPSGLPAPLIELSSPRPRLPFPPALRPGIF